MGIGDWFKRFKRNAAAMEEYREGVAPGQQTSDSQAARAAHERTQTQRESASDGDRSGNDN